MANARFRVNRLLKLTGRPGVLACGEIVGGKIAVGMSLLWPLYGDALTIATPITSVDYVDSERLAGRTEMALGVGFEEHADEEEQLVKDLFDVGLVVEVAAAKRSGS